MRNCNGCGKFVSPASAARCSQCSTSYHRACVNIPGHAEIVADWLCPACKIKIPKGDKSATPVKGISGDYVDRTIASCSKGAGSGGEVPAAASSVPRIDLGVEIRDELRALNVNLSLLRDDFNRLQASVESTNKRIDSLESRLEVLESRPAEPAECKKHADLERTIVQLKRELGDGDQELLSSDLEISNLPEEKSENLIHTVTLIASKIGSPLEERDIVFAERIGAPTIPTTGAGAGRARCRRVVVRLARRGLRDDLLRAARVRRTTTTADLGYTSGAQRFYLNERLTRSNKSLLYKTKQICQRLSWRFVWSRQGRVFARQTEGGPVHRLYSEADLERVFGAEIVSCD